MVAVSSETAESPVPVTPLCDPLPPDGVLAHIGVHKTGTTSIQSVLAQQRPALAEHGVTYPGVKAAHHKPALALTRTPWGPDATKGTPPDHREWEGLVADVAAARGRCVISSEFFADAEDDETIARIVEQLGGDRVHVLVTLRPLAKIMPSQWQQYVQNGLRMGYGDWLEHMLRKAPYEQPNPSFWRRHRHDRLVARWARAVGTERITVVVVDDRDRGGLMRTFEALLGLPANLLQPVPDTANRSLTLAETEMLRNLNREFRGNGLPDELYSRLVRNGAVMHMKNSCSPAPQDVKISTPRWAAEAAAGIAAEMIDAITRTGVRVVGDPALLSTVPEPAGEPPQETRIAPEVAAQALYGALAAAAEVPVRHSTPAKSRTVHQTSSVELVKVLGHRCLRRLRRH